MNLDPVASVSCNIDIGKVRRDLREYNKYWETTTRHSFLFLVDVVV